MSIKNLLEKRSEAVKALNNMVELAEKEDRGLSAEEREQFDKIETDISSYDDRIERNKKAQAFGESLDEPASEVPAAVREIKPENEERGNYEGAFNVFARQGAAELDAEQRQMLMEKRAQASGSDAAGGYTIPEGWANEIVEAMKAFGGIASKARILNTATGQPLPFVTNDDTGNKGEIIGENAQHNEQDLTFGQKTLGAYKYSSKVIRVPVELLQDNAINLESFIGRKFGERLGRITAEHHAVGTGTGQPMGLYTAATTGVTAASATAVTYSELVDLEHSVDPAYRGGGSYGFNDQTFKALKTMLDADGRPLWRPNIDAAISSRFNGYEYFIDQDAPNMATGLDSILFGDVSHYLIRRVLGFTMVRLVERYADFGQVGFLAYMREDADLLDANAVKVLTQA